MPAVGLSIDPYFRQQVAEIPAPDADGGIALVGAAALRVLNNQNEPAPRQRSRAQCLSHNPIEDRSVSHRSNPFHVVTKTYGTDMEASRTVTVRTPREPKSARLNKRELAEQVAEALQQDFGRYAVKHKVIAEHAGASSDKTAKAWTSKSSLPALEYFLELGRRSPALRAMTMRLWEMEHEMDPGMQKAWIEFCQMMARAGTK